MLCRLSYTSMGVVYHRGIAERGRVSYNDCRMKLAGRETLERLLVKCREFVVFHNAILEFLNDQLENHQNMAKSWQERVDSIERRLDEIGGRKTRRKKRTK
jgi:hypothetical protein